MEFLLGFFSFFGDFEFDRFARRGGATGFANTGYGPINTGYGPINVGYGPIN